MNTVELIAVFFGIVSVILLIKEIQWSWYFGIINVSLFAYVFYEKKIWGQVALQGFFLILQFYGLYSWAKKKESIELQITNLQNYFLTLLMISILSFLILFSLYSSNEKKPLDYLDSLITGMSFVAQFLQARKILQNWILWIIVDVLSVYLFYASELYSVMFFYCALLFLASSGYFVWKKKSQH